MCTLTFVNGSQGVYLTSNRDEHINRGISRFPTQKELSNQTLTFPQDPAAGGSWIASNNLGRVSVLLNGAFHKHKHQPPYRESRGLVLLNSFEYDDLSQFSNAYNLNNIEPFTMVNIHTQKQVIEEIRWDGKNHFLKEFDYAKNHIWSSATLYTPETIEERAHWFTQWVLKPEISSKDMLDFHHFGGGKNTYNSIKMKRSALLKTVSISQISAYKNEVEFLHNNLLNHESKMVVI